MDIDFRITNLDNRRNSDGYCTSFLQGNSKKIKNFTMNLIFISGFLFRNINELCGLDKNTRVVDSKKFESMKTKFKGKNIKEIIFSGNIKYIGCIKDGKMHGNAEILIDNKKYYTGEFRENLFHGKGELISNYGDHYIGDFYEDNANGRCIIKYKEGCAYYGEIIDNLYNGHGVFIYLNGSRFEGKYNEGIRSGFGTLILNQIYGEVLEIYSNNWDDIHLHSPARIICNRKFYHYEGEVKTDLFVEGSPMFHMKIFPNGKGRLFKNDRVIFEGNFKNGVREGYGREFSNNRIKFKGMFSNDLYHGLGTAYKDDMEIFFGNFEYGLRHGEFTDHIGFDTIEISNYKRGIKFGKSIKTDSNLKPKTNYYFDNTIVSTKIKDFNELGITSNDRCAISHNLFKKNDNVTKLPKCGHVFHSKSLFEWLEIKNDCPLCRSENIFDGHSFKKRKL
tara:strand:- start:137 stop:1480 length:1344 start_codon:yes stop_codon:yes gene_type:complete